MSVLDHVKARYMQALHAMQTGVKMLMQVDPGDGDTGETSPKHLRVGVNSSLINSSALAQVLMEKGIITELEYVTKLATFAEADVHSYEQRLSQYFEKPVTLR
jgi:hypothetical protein